MSLLYRLRRSEEYARAEDRASPLGLSEIFHPVRKDLWKARGSQGTHRGSPERMVLLFLPVHGVPALLCLLPLWHRYLRNHDDGKGTAESRWLQYQLGDRAGFELFSDRKSSGHSSP